MRKNKPEPRLTPLAGPRVASARKAAADALIKLHGGMYANLAAKSVPACLSVQDRAFAGALFYGSAEHIIFLDAVINTYTKKPVQKLDVEVRALLECGLYQLLFMQVPPSAAVNEAVKLTRQYGKSSAAGFVNAVLRKVAVVAQAHRTGSQGAVSTKSWLAAFGLYPATETQRFSLEYSLSEAIVKAIMAAYPQDYEAFFASTVQPAKGITIHTNSLKTTPQVLLASLAAEGVNASLASPTLLPNAIVAHFNTAVSDSLAFQRGEFHVQGLASQYAAACLPLKQGDKALDLCAAPGGKSAVIAQSLGGGKGLIACDLHPHRVELIHNTLQRLGLENVAVQQWDATVFNQAFTGQNAVLCDVPCSGLGVLAKKPDMRLTDGAGFAVLPAVQLQILENAAQYVVPGGVVVYATCTILPAENNEVIAAFLAKNQNFKCVKPLLPPFEGATITSTGITFLPQYTNVDGFFVATLKRLW